MSARKPRSTEPVAEWLQSAAGGDVEAFERVYDHLAPRVHGLVLGVVGDPHESEDVTRQVFVEIWRTAATYDPTRASATGWALVIAHRRAVDRARSRAPQPERDDSSALVAPSRTEQSGVARSVLDAVSTLPTDQRRAVELAYLEGRTCADVADRMSAATGTTQTRIRSALLELGARLRARGVRMA